MRSLQPNSVIICVCWGGLWELLCGTLIGRVAGRESLWVLRTTHAPKGRSFQESVSELIGQLHRHLTETEAKPALAQRGFVSLCNKISRHWTSISRGWVKGLCLPRFC